ncbi:MAG: hypothetical protein AB9903_27640 [Vulcanimicrobiota bacterium]
MNDCAGWLPSASGLMIVDNRANRASKPYDIAAVKSKDYIVSFVAIS